MEERKKYLKSPDKMKTPLKKRSRKNTVSSSSSSDSENNSEMMESDMMEDLSRENVINIIEGTQDAPKEQKKNK